MIRLLLAAALAAAMSSAAGATTLSFSDVSYTGNSVTFTIDGDLTGYLGKKADKNDYRYQFSLRYGSDMVNDSSSKNYGANTWSTSAFDNFDFKYSGNTGGWGGLPYSWSWYDGDLSTAVASNRTVTLSLPTDYLNVDAHNPVISFLWGNGQSDTNPIVLAKVSATAYEAVSETPAVPLPASLPLLGAALLGGLGLSRLRARKA